MEYLSLFCVCVCVREKMNNTLWMYCAEDSDPMILQLKDLIDQFGRDQQKM